MTKVLIADNDRAVSGLLTEVLQRVGLQAVHAFDGEAAQRLARAPGLAVLICDLDMPGASGLEVLESLRDLPSPPKSVVISGYLDHGIESRLRALPFVCEVMSKPFDLLRFANSVKELADRAAKPAAATTSASEGLLPGAKRGDDLGRRSASAEQ